jgi:trehalose synthase-fused probable maltokinase
VATDVTEAVKRGDLSFLDANALAAFMISQRWFASKTREVTQLDVLGALPLALEPPLLVTGLVGARFGQGTHDVYQLPLGLRSADEWQDGVIDRTDGFAIYDALADPGQARRLLELMSEDATVTADEASGCFRWAEGFPRPSGGDGTARPIGSEQSNSSVVFDDALVLKAYRRVEPGVNPELELLRFLAERGFSQVPAFAGWYEYSGAPMDATLGILQEFLPGSRDGWELALEELAVDPETFLGRLHALGEMTGAMHSLLGSDSSDPTFAPEEPTMESLGLFAATVDEEIEQIFFELPDDEMTRPIAGRGEEVREQLRLRSNVGGAGKIIRTHGDYHLGQTLLSDRGWIAIDFEGEPARTLPERRRKRSPLRDVAGMLRSFAYAASASEILHGAAPPADWELRARSEFLEGYLATTDTSLLPSGRGAFEQLLSVFELEKAAYELRYELNNRPDWVGVPVAGIARLLEEARA